MKKIITIVFLVAACGGTEKTKPDMPPAENGTAEKASDLTEPTDAQKEEMAKLGKCDPNGWCPDPMDNWREYRKTVDKDTGLERWEGPSDSKIEVQKEEVSDEEAHKTFLKSFYERLAEQQYELKNETLEPHPSRPAYFRTYLFSFQGVDYDVYIWNYMDRGNAVTISGRFPLGSDGLKKFQEFLKSKKHKTEK